MRTKVRVVAVLCVIGGVSGVFAGTGLGFGATPNTPFSPTRIDAPDPQLNGRWAERTVAAGDVNRDRVPDFWVAVPQLDVGGVADTGRVYLMSGADGSVLDAIDSPEPQTNSKFGFYISVPGDVDDDGVADIVIGTDAQDVMENGQTNTDQGKAWAFSGADGSQLYELDNPVPQADTRFGSRIGRAGQINRDDDPDVIVGASNQDLPAGCAADGVVEEGCHRNQGQTFIFDGSNGRLLRTLNLPDADQAELEDTSGRCGEPPVPGGTRPPCGTFGVAVQGPGDVDGDGVADQLVGAANFKGVGRMYVFSGNDGGLIHRIDDPDPQQGATFGFQDATPLAPGDVNGDGHADIYGNGFLQDVGTGPEGNGQGRSWVFSGKTAEVLYTLDDPTPEPGGQFGWSLASTLYNNDRTPDLYIGQSPHHEPGADERGGTYIFHGKDGSLLKPLEIPESDAQPGGPGNGGSRLGWTLAVPGDLNRDGEFDYLAGGPFQDVGQNKDAGILFAFLSRARCGVREATRMGTVGNDVITGTPGRDVIAGLDGDDEITGSAAMT